MRVPFAPAMLCLVALAGCTRPAASIPSLAPRAAEAIDPRVPLPSEPSVGPVDAALQSRIDALVAVGLGGRDAFEPAMARAEALAGGAGGPGSENWIQAQQALSAAIAARAATSQAMADIDALAGQRLQTHGDLAPGDLRAIEAASAAVGAVDRAQARRVAAVQARLGI